MSLTPRLASFDHGGFWHPGSTHISLYCLIPKNGSSWISQTLNYNGWREGCPVQPIDELIVVLRDPVERWIAGIAQYLSSYILHSHWYDRTKFDQGYHGNYIPGKINYKGSVVSGQQFVESYNEVVERLLFEQIAFDDHTQEQSWFVEYFNPTTYTWFYLNESFEQTFLYTFRDMDLTASPNPDYNRGKDNEHVRVICDFLRERIASRPYLKNALERYYRRDYEMIESADFKWVSPEELTSGK
jgi:hypothetical protein